MVCPRCKREFEQGRTDQIYCSRICQQKEKLSRRGIRRNKLKPYKVVKAYREIILSFLGNKCFKCSNTENLEIHHIVPRFLNGRNDCKNLMALCCKCHKLLHLDKL